MARRIVIKKDAKALGASQIMISLIHLALGILWVFLYKVQNEEQHESPKKDIPVILLILYLFISSLFLTFAIVTNIISVLMSLGGLIILSIGFISFESRGNEFTWINVASMMLLQFLVLSTISVLVLARILIHWMRKAFHYEEFNEESPSSTSSLPSVTISIYSRH